VRHGIQYDLFQVQSVIDGESVYVDKRAQAQIYSEHFAPRVSILNPRNEDTLPKTWRSRSGGYFVVSRVTVLESGQVGWVTQSKSYFRRFPQLADAPYSYLQHEINFLQAVRDNGIDLLRDLCFPIVSTPEQMLTDSFLASDALCGEYHRETRVGWKAVDLVCYTSDRTWVLEVEQRLTWEAFGQVIGYGWLYTQGHPTVTISRGIVCGSSDDTIEAICRAPEFAVTVFLATDQGFIRRGFLPQIV
jgi:hypothetical protein